MTINTQECKQRVNTEKEGWSCGGKAKGLKGK